MPDTIPFETFDHTNVRVADLDASIRFYTEVLGFEYIGRRDMAPTSPTVSAYVKFAGVVVELAAGHNMADYAPAGIINHFALTVPDIHAAHRYFRAHGVEPLGEPLRVNDDFYCFFVEGPSKEKFEIIQYL